MPENIISCRPSCYGKFSLYAYEHLYEIGIRYMEIPNPGPQGVESILDILAEFPGMQVKSIQASIPIEDTHPGELMQASVFEVAQDLDATHVFVSLKTGDLSRDTWVSRLQEVGDVAREHHLTIILETHPNLITNGDVGRETMKAVNHPQIRINYDTANMYFYNRNIDGIEELKKLLPFVEGVHLKESNMIFKSWFFPGLHEAGGKIDFSQVFKILNNRKIPGPFLGPFTLEIEGIKGEESLTLQSTKARVTQSITYLREIGAFS